MDTLTVVAIACAFLAAGLAKGVIGFGLPTVAIALLSQFMTPGQAAALVILPSIVTNAWQALAGGHLGPLLRRIWPILAGIWVGTLVGFAGGLGLAPGRETTLTMATLGAALMIYAGLGLSHVRPRIPASCEGLYSVMAGTVTGIVTSATGVFVIPVAPYLQALGLQRDSLVQAMGVSFLTSTLALGVGLADAGFFRSSLSTSVLVALVAVFAGMAAGRRLRRHIPMRSFRLVFFTGLFALGLSLFCRSLP